MLLFLYATSFRKRWLILFRSGKHDWLYNTNSLNTCQKFSEVFRDVPASSHASFIRETKKIVTNCFVTRIRLSCAKPPQAQWSVALSKLARNVRTRGHGPLISARSKANAPVAGSSNPCGPMHPVNSWCKESKPPGCSVRPCTRRRAPCLPLRQHPMTRRSRAPPGGR